MLETVNYVEHYGLVREKDADGRSVEGRQTENHSGTLSLQADDLRRCGVPCRVVLRCALYVLCGVAGGSNRASLCVDAAEGMRRWDCSTRGTQVGSCVPACSSP
jgi:hypothetical protein